jgi:hypothetical protein
MIRLDFCCCVQIPTNAASLMLSGSVQSSQKEACMSLSKKRHILATADAGFIETVMDIPYRTCTGCSHYHRIRLEAPEWLLSVNCPCVECSSSYLLGYAERLEHWTSGRIGGFAEDEWFDPDRADEAGGISPRRPVEIIVDYARGWWGILNSEAQVLN